MNSSQRRKLTRSYERTFPIGSRVNVEIVGGQYPGTVTRHSKFMFKHVVVELDKLPSFWEGRGIKNRLHFHVTRLSKVQE